MNRPRNKERGFSAIELLITLFVLAAFLVAGVQLYNVVINDGGASRSESRAANLAYNYLRQSSNAASSPCTEATPVDGESVNVQGLIDVSVTVTVTCPHGVTSEVSKVEASVSYNNPSETVTYATYVIGQDGDESSVTDSLVGWWRFNGNANNYITSVAGTVNGASLTTGQNGQANGAYSFNGTSDYINLGTGSPLGILTNDFTVSAWVKTTTGGNVIGASRATSANGFRATLGAFTTYGVKDYIPPSSLGATDNLWHLVIYVLSNNNLTFYVDGVNHGTDTHTTGGIANTDDPYFIGATTANASATPSSFFSGTIDDLRVYSKVLSNDEIQTIFSEGAF